MTKAMLTAIAITTACGMTACAPARTQSVTASDLALMQSRLAASEEKMDQLSQRVALLQTLVDSHQRALQNFEYRGTEDTGAGQSDAKPLQAISDSQAVPSAGPEESEPSAIVEKKLATEDTAQDLQGTEPAPPLPQESRDVQKESATQVPAADAASAVDEANSQYRHAMEVFRSGDYEAAAPLFEAFAGEFPEDDLADNALYWAGECKYTKKKFTEAIKRFKRVVEEHPSGSKVPDALLKIGYAYISLGDRESAETYLKKVVVQYPFSNAGVKAEERLKELQGQ